MLPKVSPNSSLKNGPRTPSGSVPRMSPTFLRTWYEELGHASPAARVPSMITNTSDTPGRE